MDRIPRTRIDKFAERRAELGEAALQTLAELGYARTSLREIAQNSEFSHGVLHYYFTDKLDLILCSVRQYKARCVKRYDEVTAMATSYDELLEGFVKALGDTLRKEAPLHRLWYDLRAQSLFEAALKTLSELGYARTSLREIAQNSEFSHGVLHYYFTDKVDLITHCVKQYKAQCVQRYDQIIADARTADALCADFAAGLGSGLVPVSSA